VVAAAHAAGLSLAACHAAHVYLIEGEFSAAELERVTREILVDSVTQASGVDPLAEAGCAIVEVHPLPGVMDPAAQSVRDAIRVLLGRECAVSTGVRYALQGASASAAQEIAKRLLANPVIQQIHAGDFAPKALPRGHGYTLKLRHVPIRDLTDEQLATLSRDAHLFLSLDEMRSIRAEYQTLGREPTDIEIETIAQTWSEHCVHKTLKSTIRYRETERQTDGEAKFEARETGGVRNVLKFAGRAGHTANADGSVTIHNLLKTTVAAATFDLIADGIDWTLSVFKDNSGIIALDDSWGVCIKVETHNHPSAIEPYGGAATGAGGCIRDVIGTGLGAKPIASTDVFCVAHPDHWSGTPGSATGSSGASVATSLPPGCLHPRRILTDVVAGVRDYGNRMGIPTVNGAVAFDDRHVGNPLVFCGCVGLIPRDKIKGQARHGDRIIALGGRTGRDGIHGATFSSAELEHTAADEFSHAVQIGNAIEEKRVLEVVLRAANFPTPSASANAESRVPSASPLFHAITDCGAGGFSSAVGEMGGEIGATVDLDKAPLKYDGLSYTEIWISEAQERMVLAVPESNLAALRQICREEGVELADLGTFGTAGSELVLRYQGTEVGRLPMHFLHEGIPTPTREATWAVPSVPTLSMTTRTPVATGLKTLLSHPNVASKHWIVRQYDHEVQGNTIVKPLVGSGGRGPGDASVLEPVPGTNRGIALACGLQTPLGDAQLGGDPYVMVLAAIDECVRNLVCVGADPSRVAILDNFCWPSCQDPANLGSLVRAAEGCYDGAMAYRTPFVSGKDSLNNQFKYDDHGTPRVIQIPPTLLVTGIGIVPDVRRCITMDAKHAGNVIMLVGATEARLGASLALTMGLIADADVCELPGVDLKRGPATAKAIAQLIRDGLICSAHDCSEGGWLVALAEMLIATTRDAGKTGAPAYDMNKGGPLGATIALDTGPLDHEVHAFSETPSRYLVEVAPGDVAKVRTVLTDFGERVGGIFAQPVAHLTDTGELVWNEADMRESVSDLAHTWRSPLDW